MTTGAGEARSATNWSGGATWANARGVHHPHHLGVADIVGRCANGVRGLVHAAVGQGSSSMAGACG